MTPAMMARASCLKATWKDEGEGYHTLIGQHDIPLMGIVSYVAIPEDHPLCDKDYSDFDEGGPDVNGGLTFANDNVFGWDYMHCTNRLDFEGDRQRAVRWFKDHAHD